jgi:hypothetical protein
VGASHKEIEAAAPVSTCRVKESSRFREAPVKYLVLIYTNPETRQLWEQLPEAEQSAGLQAYAALNENLTASGR